MNLKRLNRLFQMYIDHFDEISFGEHDETYKWEVTAYYRKNFHLHAEDFAAMLDKLRKKAENLIDNSLQKPFYALVHYARLEPETVREMFEALYADDRGDLSARQKKINVFIAKSEALRKKYNPDSWLWKNDQRSVMAYLFFHDPDHNYLYKWKQVREFADFAGFTTSLSSGEKFRLSAYYKMCDSIVGAMQGHEGLMAANAARFEQGRTLYPDKELHLLCFDMIYSSQVYGLYNGLYYSRLTASERKKFQAEEERALRLRAAYEKALEQENQLNRIRDYITGHLAPGAQVTSKAYGAGAVEALEGRYASVRFPEPAGVRQFDLLPALANGYIVPKAPGLGKYIRENAALMRASLKIPVRRQTAESELEPYKDLL